jgi:adenylate kinase
MEVTVVTGVPGVGASRICREARREFDDRYELVNFGDVMLEEAASRGLVEARDGLATLPVRDLRLLQRRAGEYVAARARGRAIILNTHLAVATVHGFLPGLPGPVLSDVDPDRFVVIETDPATVAQRRESVDHREYREQGERSIAFHRDLTRSAAMSYATATGAPVRLVDNEGPVEDAVSSLTAIVVEGDPT